MGWDGISVRVILWASLCDANKSWGVRNGTSTGESPYQTFIESFPCTFAFSHFYSFAFLHFHTFTLSYVLTFALLLRENNNNSSTLVPLIFLFFIFISIQCNVPNPNSPKKTKKNKQNKTIQRNLRAYMISVTFAAAIYMCSKTSDNMNTSESPNYSESFPFADKTVLSWIKHWNSRFRASVWFIHACVTSKQCNVQWHKWGTWFCMWRSKCLTR